MDHVPAFLGWRRDIEKEVGVCKHVRQLLCAFILQNLQNIPLLQFFNISVEARVHAAILGQTQNPTLVYPGFDTDVEKLQQRNILQVLKNESTQELTYMLADSNFLLNVTPPTKKCWNMVHPNPSARDEDLVSRK
eukprot:TRINITY_DN44449_c0_g1_i1.p2 TRINITY_DN44449_c0_g1~~TRINITY_DN44449_c0_g1_i1.p2  ORF type:complete len:135 (-),score=27.22 TRINITY_DN44449_c0_g1_i1:544-948(-)